MPRLTLFCLFLLLFAPLTKVSATHIVGGEMTYRCLGNNQYEITLVIFRDCFYGNPAAWFDDPASIGVFNAANELVQDIRVSPIGNDTLQPILDSDCYVLPPDVCVHTTMYRTVVQLLPSPGGYILAYQRCCRNQTIANIVEPLATGATYSVSISEYALEECNTSPVFSTWPPIYICAGVPIFFDQSATDADGDSLVYRLCDPLQGATQFDPIPQPPYNPPYETVIWVDPPYNVNNMLNGTPGDPPLAINIATGLLTGLPNTIGQFVVGICVEEYRNGLLIGTMRRDFQYNVGVCSQTTAAFFAPEIQCGNLQVNFQNQSTSASSFRWEFNDPQQPGLTSSLANPSFTYTEFGNYAVRLVAMPGTPCEDTLTRLVKLLPGSLQPDFDVSFGPCADTVQMTVTDLSTDPLSTITSWNWLLNPGLQSSTSQNPIFTLTGSNNYSLQLMVRAENGCMDTIVEPFPVNLIDILPDQALTICLGETATLNLSPQANQPYTYLWQPDTGIEGANNNSSVLVRPQASTTYTALVTNPSGCSLRVDIPVTVLENSLALVATATPDSILPGEQAQLLATFDPDYTYQWSPPNTLNNAFIHNPTAAPVQTTTYEVTATDRQGCTTAASVTVLVRAIECREPYIYIPNGFSPNGDGKNDVLYVRGTGIDEMELIIYNRWGEKVFETSKQDLGWDGTFRGKLLKPDVYAYYMRVRCFNGQDYVKQGNITLLR
jgi:gliding motility-associated-like protein